jgi:nucleotide-binding universal stress UspA family protein
MARALNIQPCRRETGVGDAHRTFARVVCLVGERGATHAALRQACRLAAPGARLLLLAVFDSPASAWTGMGELLGGAAPADPRWTLLRAAGAGTEHLGSVELRLCVGSPAEVLERVADEEDAGLLVVGDDPEGARVLRRPTRPILIARPEREPERFPRSTLVAADQSPAAEQAAGVAASIGERFDAQVEHVSVPPTRAGFRRLLRAAETVDLVVVGTERTRLLRLRRSLAERVGRRAACSVLVVRP